MQNKHFKTWMIVLALIGIALAGGTARAATIGLTGYTNDFFTQPAAADWSTISVGTASATIATTAGLDAAVEALFASSVATQVGLGVNEPPDAAALGQWAPTGRYVQTRPTGVDFDALMCTLVNNLGVSAASVTISYDFLKAGAANVEEIDGHRVYYSFTGAANSWTNIPQLSTAVSGRLTATITNLWPNGGTLYILWADDNGSGSPDPAMQIDNFSAIAVAAEPIPAAIVTQPQNQTVAERAPATFSVVATGNPAPTYQWYKNSNPISNATNSSYSIASALYSDNNAVFSVVVQNIINDDPFVVPSDNAVLRVNPDTNAPTVTRILPTPGSTNRDLTSIEVLFSEPVDGVDAGDLLINGVPAATLTLGGPGQFVFHFPEPAIGLVSVAWTNTHGIVDQGALHNAFAGGAWTYTLDPHFAPITFRINEFLASNNKGLRDEDGDDPDWIEIYNAALDAGNLQGWYLTDDPFNLTKWQFPYRVMDPGTYLVVFASNKNRTNTMAGTIYTNLHANFVLPASGSYLALVDPNTNVVSAFAPTYPPQSVNVSYGRDQQDPNFVGYFATPTPRKANSTTGAGIAPEVVFSRDSGNFLANAPFSLALSTASTNAVIFYAFGTNLPGSNTVAYTNGTPIPVNNTLAVRARAFEPGKLPGPVTTKFYVAIQNLSNVVNFSSGLPIMVLHNYGQGAVPVNKSDQYVFMEVFDNDLGYASLTNPPTLTARGDFHVRGSSTAVDSSAGKSSFFLEIRDEFDQGRSVPLLGLSSESDWALYAPNNFEPALIHNPLAHQLYRDMGRYGSHTRFFELWLKDDTGVPGAITSAEYNGIYVLEEKVKRDDNRVNIARLDAEDTTYPAVTGGYLLSIDRTPPGEITVGVNFTFPNGGATINYVSPNGFIMTNSLRGPQTNYIRNYLNQFNADLSGINYTNVATTNHYSNYIDVDSWIDLHIHETLTFNVDGMRLSGYFYKDRNKKLEYGPTWDYDRTQGSTDGRDFNPRTWQSTVSDLGTDFFNPQVTAPSVPWWGRLFTANDFWQAWIDRYQLLRLPGEALSTNNIYQRIDMFANMVRVAEIRETNRWGSLNAGRFPRTGSVSGGGYTYNFGSGQFYQAEIDFEKNWYSNRLDFADTNLLALPTFSVTPGALSNTTTVTITPAAGLGDKPANSQLLLTLDGTDPRLPGGGIRVGATVLSNTGPITVTVSNAARIFARSRNPNHSNLTGAHNPPISSPWSGPMVGTYYLSNSLPSLRITEIMYNPTNAPAGNTNDADNFEYLEFKNIGGTPLDVTGFRLRGGVEFDFPNLVLGGGQSCLVVADVGAFSTRYNTNGLIIAGAYTNNPNQTRLGNGGDHLKLEGSVRQPILDFDYKDGWYPTTDGGGFSLQIVDENLPTSAWGLKSSWRPSGQLNGTPGTVDPGAVNIATVYINEVLTHTDPPQFDAIELYNPNNVAVDIGGWFLTDNFDLPKKYRIPNGASITATGYVVFYADSSFGNAFNLSSKGEEIYLFSGDANTNLTGYVYGFDFGAQANGVTFGRYVNSVGDEHFPTQTAPSLGAANTGPKVGPIVFSAINYHPPDFTSAEGPLNNTRDEFVELQNITGVDQPLFDPNFRTNTWHLRGGIDYAFPTNVTIPAGGHVLVVSFDPADQFALARFRAVSPVTPGEPVFGPWSGQLNNAGDNVEIARPDVPQPANAPDANAVYYILVDKVEFSSSPPWASVGVGSYLHRVSPNGFGNDPNNWVVPVTIVAQPQGRTVRLPDVTGSSTNISLSVAAGGSPPLGYQWRVNGTNIPGATSNVLALNNLSFDQNGDYTVIVSNPYNASTSTVARVNVYSSSGWRFASVTGTIGTSSNGLGTNLFVFMNLAGETYLDDVSLVPLSGPSAGVNLIQNGDFEAALSSGSNPWIVPPSMGTSGLSSTYAHSGLASLHVVNTNAGNVNTNSAIYQTFPRINTNILCTLSFWFRTIANGTNLTVRIFPGSALIGSTNVQPVDAAPGIGSQPVSAVVPAGAATNFSVAAYGSEPLSYQWFKDAVPLANGGKISGATTATLTVSQAGGAEVGNYSVRVANVLGFASSSAASLSVVGDPPLITLQPQSQTVPCTSNVTFTVAASGTAPLTYQWKLNGSIISNATDATLFLTNARSAAGGTYTVLVSNPIGSSNSVGATLVVVDTEPPVVVCSSNRVVQCSSPSGTPVSFSSTATDNCDANVTVNCTPASGSLFVLGDTTVTCAAVDSSGNSNSCTFLVTVLDTTPPSMNCPTGLTTACTGTNAAQVNLGATATDSCDGSVTVTCTPPTGSFFALGTNTVTCGAIDSHGNSNSCTFLVVVADTTPPVMSCPGNMTTACTGLNGAPASFGATAIDSCDTNVLTVTCTPPSGSFFALGTNTVTCGAADSHGNSNSCSFRVVVVDTTAPSITCPASMTTACTGTNGAPVSFSATAADSCDTNVTVTCTPPSGSFFARGTNTVTCVAMDASGNTNRCTFTITVEDHTVPRLSASRQGTNIVLSWPQTCTPYVLEQSSAVGAQASWSSPNATIAVSDDKFTATIPLGGLKFFRLRQQ